MDKKSNIGSLGWEPQRNEEGTDVGEALIEGEVINLVAKASLGTWVLNASQHRQFLKGRSKFQAEAEWALCVPAERESKSCGSVCHPHWPLAALPLPGVPDIVSQVYCVPWQHVPALASLP